jgi:two-component system, NtrC family, sensor kinase
MPEAEKKGPEQETLSLGSILTAESFSSRDKEFGSAADKALKDRPFFSIRMRIILSFALFFIMSVAITLWAIHILAKVQDKILFLEIADDFEVEIQQARRFEKNFLLYGTDLKEAREHVGRARHIITEYNDRFKKVLGEKSLQNMNDHLAKYQGLLSAAQLEQNTEKLSDLRDHGTRLLTLANEFVGKERKLVHSMLVLTRRIPLIFLGALFVLMGFIVVFLARQLLGTLSRFMGYTQRIATGDFTPIMPTRKYRDEFSELALTINQMMRDLERQHNILAESQKLRAMGTLVAGVAHEVNNPINNILLTASMLQEDSEVLDEEETQEMVQDIISQSDRAKKIIANLLDFARESETKVQPLDIRSLLEHTTQLVSNQIRIKKLRLSMSLEENLPAVHGDRQLLSQVFMNLILNAIDVLPEMGVIQIRVKKGMKEGFLAMEIADNGPGIPEHIRDQIFDPFFTTKSKGKGTGLGLSVSRGIVRRLGGHLLVESQLGKGTVFTVLLPITYIPSGISSGDKQLESQTGVPGNHKGD